VSLRVVGAGVGRTGTASLKLALEQLLDGRCYHMLEVLGKRDADVFWAAATRGEREDFDAALAGYVAAVDWPASAFWRELAADSPGALILLSLRDSPESWWTSYEATIVRVLKERVADADPLLARHGQMVIDLFRARFTPGWDDRAQAIAAYERHNEDVRASADPGRLLEWRAGDGWEPICAALGLAVPDEPFPHENTTADFNARAIPR
jgi:Sulfotransferase domain